MTVEIVLLSALCIAVACLCFGLKSVLKSIENGLKSVTHDNEIIQTMLSQYHDEVMRELEEPPLDDSVKLKEEDVAKLYRDKDGLLSWEAFRRNTRRL